MSDKDKRIVGPDGQAPEPGPEQPDVPEVGDDTNEVPPQIVYGISLFFMDNGKPHVEMTGEPSLLDLQMLLAPALANIEGDIVASKVLSMFQAEHQARASEAATAAIRARIGKGRP